ncbi:MAG: carbohydrate binding family 9 domain-containing protein [Acidobacteria bacterium]|nr:carbohydrate binding family 9 domain-containing protein [Acidobacteriota bacterium]
MTKKIIPLLIVILMFVSCVYSAGKKDQKIHDITAYFTETPIQIDGKLSEAVWQNTPSVDDIFISWEPAFGSIMKQKTRVWVAYDNDNLYFAFYAYDDEPEKIKTSIGKHDDIGADDWVAVLVDTTGSKQFGYAFFCNPSGIQTDMLMNSQGNTDSNPDWVWYSAGGVVEDGYIAEMHIPLKNIKYTSGENVEMNVLFARFIGRENIQGGWPIFEPGESPYQAMTKITYKKLNGQTQIEILPSITYGVIYDRESPDDWVKDTDQFEVGVSGKIGLTSTITAEFTINPDFSQVESDSFQVLVNQRYPVFYAEKRPFFMESNYRFSMAAMGSGDYNMYYPLYTRNIVDPEWGMKLSGETGNLTFDVLLAGDNWPGRKYDDEINPYAGDTALYAVGRMKYSFSPSFYIGGIVADREFADGYNRVFGGDVQLLIGSHTFMSNYLYSETTDEDGLTDTNGSAWGVEYSFQSPIFSSEIFWEHLDPEFRMDTAYYKRIGMDKVTAYAGFNLVPQGENWSWIQRINPFVFGYYLQDIDNNEDDYFYLVGLRINMSNQGYFRIDYRFFREYWEHIALDGEQMYINGSAQFTKWLYIYTHFYFGEDTYYDSNPIMGDFLSFNLEFNIQPNEKFTQNFDYTYQKMNNPVDDSLLYDINILRSWTTYQFDEHLFFRAIVQYDSYRERVLTDLLASYTLTPGTVVHLGYGSLHLNKTWKNDQWVTADELAEYYQMTQSFFFKASYLFQL